LPEQGKCLRFRGSSEGKETQVLAPAARFSGLTQKILNVLLFVFFFGVDFFRGG